MLALAGGFGLILYQHGASWWYVPLAVVLAHVATLGGVVFVATRITRARHAPDGAAGCRRGGGPAHDGRSTLIRRPRLYDWLVRVITLGLGKKLRQRMLDLADLRPDDKVLDVGCGTGTLLLAAAGRVGPRGTLHGLEPAAEMVAYARQKAEARGVPLEVVEGSADDLPYAPASFDAVFCTMVLHHLPAPMRVAAIREMRRVLRPEGRAVIVDLCRPKSPGRAITAALSLVSLLHNLGPGAPPRDLLTIEPLMTELGFEDVARHSFGSGAVGAVVGRLGSGQAIEQRPDA